MAPRNPQTIAYPSPTSRPHRRDLEALVPHVIVLFGATGDLAKRKLLPGLAYLCESALAPDLRVVGSAMEAMTTEQFRELAKAAVRPSGRCSGGAGRHPPGSRRGRGQRRIVAPATVVYALAVCGAAGAW